MNKSDVIYMRDGVGFVELIDYLGGDLTTVNAARVSMGKRKSEFDSKDEGLVRFLGTSDPEHSSPFRHGTLQLHVKAPEFVARQWYKHIVGTDYIFKDSRVFKDTAWNEISGRYIELQEFWYPEYFRPKAENKKQGSRDEKHQDNDLFLDAYNEHIHGCVDLYKEMLERGVAPEQARTVLPFSTYTEWYWTASLQAVLHFVRLRNHPEAQKEIQEYAVIVENIVTELFPASREYFRDRA